MDNYFAIDDVIIERKLLKAPFGYSGGKQNIVDKLLPLIPYSNGYVEPFGGGASVLLARNPSPLEVYNDAYGGVVDFYRVIKNDALLEEFCQKIELEIHSREQFKIYHDTLDQTSSIVDRAVKWYYLTIYSFNSLGKVFGRTTSGKNVIVNKIINKIPEFDLINKRLRNVTIENLDYSLIIEDFAKNNTVFYCDPPYLGTNKGSSKKSFLYDDHFKFLELIHASKGYYVVSSYKNDLYESFNWDEKHYFDVPSRAVSLNTVEGNNKTVEVERSRIIEAVYIKKGVI